MTLVSSLAAKTEALAELLADGAMSVKEAAEFSGLSRTTLYRLMEQIDETTGGPKLPYIKMGHGGRRLIPKRALVRLMVEHMVIGEGGSRIDESASLPGNRR